MSFTDIFVRRPVLATVVSLLILLVGAQSVWNLPIRQFPKVSDTTITITTTYPGANADQIKGFITTPMQQAVASTEGIDTLKSTSAQNVSTITMKLKLDADGDRALADVLSKVNEVKGVLPRGIKRSGGQAHDRHALCAHVYRLQFEDDDARRRSATISTAW